MPLPWLFVFFAIFFCVYSVSLFISHFSLGLVSDPKPVKGALSGLPW